MLTLVAGAARAQKSNPYQPFKAYKNHEEYCRDQPKMPTCIKTGPLNLEAINGGLYKGPKSGPATAPRPRVQPATRANPTIRSIERVTLHDWRFSHPSPAMLISINLGSLLKSPLWTGLLSAWGVDVKPAEMENIRAALSDVGQMLISVSPNGTASPSVLILAKGNLDGAFGSWLRSGGGMQSKRLDAITALIGDARSIEMAGHRMRSTLTSSTSNVLQRTATREALKYDAWSGVEPRYIAALASAHGGGTNQLSGLVANIRGASFGLYLRDQLRLEIALETPSPDIADRMLTAYQQKQQASNKALGGQTWVTAEGAQLRFIAIVEGREIKEIPGFDASLAQMIGPQVASLVQSLANRNSVPGTAAAEPPKPTQGAIVIQGLPNR